MDYLIDTDLLFYEPKLADTAATVAQTLLSGTGTLAGTQFTLDAGSLTDAQVEPGMILLLTGQFAGGYAIVAINSTTQLTISRLTPGLRQLPPVAVPIGTGSSVPYAVRTFWPQRSIVTGLLDEQLDLDGATLINPRALRHPAALGTLAMIYDALSTGDDPQGRLADRAEQYRQRQLHALRATRLCLERDGTTTTRPLNQLVWTRG